MDTNRRTATLVGILFILGTLAGVLSFSITGPIFNAPEFLKIVVVNQNGLVSAALCVLFMGLALAPIPFLVFPILKKYDEILALGYIIFRGGLEMVTYMIIAFCWLLLIPLSQAYSAAGSANSPYFETLANLLVKASGVGSALTAIVFPLGAWMFYIVLFRANLLPRWLSVWGMVGVTLNFLVSGLAGLYGLNATYPNLESLLNMPIFFQELVMAVWLIARGFNQPAVVVRTFTIPGAKQVR